MGFELFHSAFTKYVHTGVAKDIGTLMARSTRYKANNKGGYGNPPVKNQFKGEPGPGRPPGSASLENAMRKLFGKKIALKGKDGKTEWMYPVEALAKRILQLGMTGSPRAAELVLALAKEYGPKEPEPDSLSFKRLSYAELTVYEYLCRKGLNEMEPHVGPVQMRIFSAIAAVIEQESVALKAEEEKETEAERGNAFE